jgi:dipeptide/tripeptide permease
MSDATTPNGTPQPFPRVFWMANLTELFERAAFYSTASFVVIYLGRLGMGDYWPSILNSVLWTLIYFLPILSGTIADQVGFRRALLVAFVLLVAGYAFIGSPSWLGIAELTPKSAEMGKEVTAGAGVWIPVIIGILLVTFGGSVVKPCISGTVQKTAALRATLGFAIFYMVINIGSLVGRFSSFTIRRDPPWGLGRDLPDLFAIALCCAAIGFLVVLLLYQDPDRLPGLPTAPARPRKSIRQIFVDMVTVFRNKRFALFLLASSGFNFLYNQVYNVLPLYVKKVVEPNPAMDLYTAANPFVIVAFQLLVTRMFGGMRPIRSMVFGSAIVGLAMLVNVVPIVLFSSVRDPWLHLLPIGSVFIILTVALIAFGELFTSARTFEYIGALAPKGQEGLFLGYANLPMAIGSILGGPVGALVFNEIMCHGATRRPNGLLQLDPRWNAGGWILLMTIGFGAALGLWLYNRWLAREIAAEQATP